MVAVGEVGLSGEIRAVSQLERRINEVLRLGFKRCLVPSSGVKAACKKEDIRIIPVSTIKEAIKVGLVGEKV